MFAVQTFHLEVKTTQGTDILDLTRLVQDKVRESGISDGVLTLFIAGSTAALTTIEYESGVINDLRAAIERLFPQDLVYEHDRRWGDGNGYSHVRAAFLKPSLSIPIEKGNVVLGTWQQIVLLDFDNRPPSPQHPGPGHGDQAIDRMKSALIPSTIYDIRPKYIS
jgi:secondary thiamine-phosphate synthase enzyme|uniref:YjbQ family protein n=1 Tax=Desulfobacca acetoxidans TaxID=60893 RepID=A0A7C5AMQ8_9BACT